MGRTDGNGWIGYTHGWRGEQGWWKHWWRRWTRPWNGKAWQPTETRLRGIWRNYSQGWKSQGRWGAVLDAAYTQPASSKDCNIDEPVPGKNKWQVVPTSAAGCWKHQTGRPPNTGKIQEKEDRMLDNVLGTRLWTVSLCRLLLWLKGRTPSSSRLHGSICRQGSSGDQVGSVRPNACNVEGHRG